MVYTLHIFQRRGSNQWTLCSEWFLSSYLLLLHHIPAWSWFMSVICSSANRGWAVSFGNLILGCSLLCSATNHTTIITCKPTDLANKTLELNLFIYLSVLKLWWQEGQVRDLTAIQSYEFKPLSSHSSKGAPSYQLLMGAWMCKLKWKMAGNIISSGRVIVKISLS